MKKEQRNKQEIIKAAVISLLEVFESNQMPESVAISIIQRKSGHDQPSFQWSFSNQLIMMLQGTTDARGYHQWKQVGRWVKKGSHAIFILAPISRKIIEIDQLTGEKKEKTIIVNFRGIPVYPVESTDGKPLEKPDYTPPEPPPLLKVAQYMGVDVEYLPYNGNYLGAFSPKNQQIRLCSEDTFVFMHELSHVAHQTIRELKPGQDAEQEIIAELSASILCQILGIQGYESLACQYIQMYTTKMGETDVLKIIMRLLNEAEAVVMKVLSLADEIKEN